MPNDMFMLRDGDAPAGLKLTAFASELEFQHLLANYPELLAGSRIDEGSPRRWLLVSRETAIPSGADGAARWAVDHLFIDQDGIPTLVEVKRQTDSRIRREVVGQMLDYAANGVVYWPVDALRARFESRCDAEGIDPGAQIKDLAGGDMDPDRFWRGVGENLRAGRVRMLFVADVLPPELRRVVEFLNEQMSPAEVLALELRRFEGQGMTTLVPTLYGRTEVAANRKGIASGTQWTQTAFIEKMMTRPDAEAGVGMALLAWIEANATPVWGRGKQDGSLSAGLSHGSQAFNALSVYTNGQVDLGFAQMAGKGDTVAAVSREWRLRVAAIPGLEGVETRNGLKLSHLADEATLTRFTQELDWLAMQLRG